MCVKYSEVASEYISYCMGQELNELTASKTTGCRDFNLILLQIFHVVECNSILSPLFGLYEIRYLISEKLFCYETSQLDGRMATARTGSSSLQEMSHFDLLFITKLKLAFTSKD